MDEQQRAAIMELPEGPAPRPADIGSPEAIVQAVYDSISGPAFIDAARDFYRESAFYEREIARRVERFGNIAHVFSTYESRVGSEDSDPVARGINSVQVVLSRDRWWIAHLVWDVASPGNPIPPEYLSDR